MDSPPQNGIWLRDELLQLLTLSGTLAGLCITGVTLFHTAGRVTVTETIADDVLAVSGLLFLGATFTLFYALRTRSKALALALERIADFLFLPALTGMTASGFIMVYTVW